MDPASFAMHTSRRFFMFPSSTSTSLQPGYLLEKCWSIDTDWSLIPSELKEVRSYWSKRYLELVHGRCECCMFFGVGCRTEQVTFLLIYRKKKELYSNTYQALLFPFFVGLLPNRKSTVHSSYSCPVWIDHPYQLCHFTCCGESTTHGVE